MAITNEFRNVPVLNGAAYWLCLTKHLLLPLLFISVFWGVPPASVQAQTFKHALQIGTTGEDSGEDVATDLNGNYVVTGFFSGTADFDPDPNQTVNLTSQGLDDIFIAKYSPEGALLWALGIGSTESDFGHGVAIDESGNIVVTGCFEGTVDFDPGAGVTSFSSEGGEDIFVLKLDPDGNFLWGFSIGGSANDGGHDIDVSSNGFVYITGGYTGTADFDPGAGSTTFTSAGELDMYLAKYDPDGNFLWAFSSENGVSNQRGWGISVDDAGNSYVSGWFKNNPDIDPGPDDFPLPNEGRSDAWVAKYDTDGNFLWGFSYGASNRDHAFRSDIDSQGNVYVAGNFRETVDFDPGPDEFNITSVSIQEAYLAKYDTDGNFLWAFNMQHSSNETSQALAVATDIAGNAIVTGSYLEGIDVDPGPGVVSLPDNGGQEGYVASYSPDGALNWAFSIGGESNDLGQSIATDNFGNVFATGKFRVAVDMGVDDGVAQTFNALGVSDAYVGVYSTSLIQPPVASFSFVENDLTVDFDASSSTDDGSIVSWDWDFGDGSSASGEVVSHTYAEVGSYTVTLTVTDNDGATGSTSETVDAGNPLPIANFSANQVFGTLDVDFDGSASSDNGSVVSWDWDFGDGNTASGEVVSHTFASLGTFSVTLTVTDDEGATGATTMDVDVVDDSGGTMHIASISTEVLRSGGAANAFSTIVVLDQDQNPVEGATVTGTFSGDLSGSDTAVTDVNGETVLASDELFVRPVDLGSCVDDVTHPTLTYDPGQNDDPGFACSMASPAMASHDAINATKGEIMNEVDVPHEFALIGNYPNPFNPTTTIRFDVPEATKVRLEVYDIMGRRVATLVNNELQAGRHEVSWNAQNDAGLSVSSGLYLYRLEAGSFTATSRMVLSK